MSFVLVDTSVWVSQFRKADPVLQALAKELGIAGSPAEAHAPDDRSL